MNSKIIAYGILKAIGVVVGLALIFFFIYKISAVISYLIVALLVTLIGNPIQHFLMERLHFKLNIATVVTLMLFVLIIVGFISLFIPLIAAQSENLSLLNTQKIEQNCLELISKIELYCTKHHIPIGKSLKISSWAAKLDFNIIPSFLNTIISMISDFGIALASILFITFFFLKDKLLFISAIKTILPDDHEEKILNSLHKIKHLLSRYFVGIIIQLSFVFVLYFIVLLIFGIDNAIVIAFLCAVLNIVPYVGPLIATVLAALLTLINNLNVDFQLVAIPTTVYVIIGFVLVQVVDNNVCQPIIFSKSIKSHPLEIFLVILIAGFLFGILGMIAAIPCYTMLKVVAKEFFPENTIIKIITKNI